MKGEQHNYLPRDPLRGHSSLVEHKRQTREKLHIATQKTRAQETRTGVTKQQQKSAQTIKRSTIIQRIQLDRFDKNTEF